MTTNNQTVIVVGGGLAGLAAAMKLAEKGLNVKLVSVTNSHKFVVFKLLHSVLALHGGEPAHRVHIEVADL